MNKIAPLLFTIIIAITTHSLFAVELDTRNSEEENATTPTEVILHLQLRPVAISDPTDYFSGPKEVSLRMGQRLTIVISSYSDDCNQIELTSPDAINANYIGVEPLKNPWTLVGWKQYFYSTCMPSNMYENIVLVQQGISYGRTTTIFFEARDPGQTVIPLQEIMPQAGILGARREITVTVTK